MPFLFFVYFLGLPHRSFISLFSSLSPKNSTSSFSFHLKIMIIKRGSSSAVVYFQLASHFLLIILKHKTLNLVRRSRRFFANATESFSLVLLQFPIQNVGYSESRKIHGSTAVSRRKVS